MITALWCPNVFQMGDAHVAFQHVVPTGIQTTGVWTREVEIFQCKRENGRGYWNPDRIAHQHPHTKVNIVPALGRNAKNAL